jgi:mannose-6-phosphate isomerase-like protein (cupin superfamily)
LHLTLDTVKTKGRLVADDERYRIHDYDLGDLTVSVTELRGGKQTRGHSHGSNAEVYFFLGGRALMEVGEEKFEIRRGAVLIPKGEFHRVVNKSKASDLLFVSVFPGKREQTNARYGSGAGSQAPRAGLSGRISP